MDPTATPVDVTPVAETLVDESPVAETSADESSAAETSADESSADESSAAEPPAYETSTAETSAAETPAAETFRRFIAAAAALGAMADEIASGGVILVDGEAAALASVDTALDLLGVVYAFLAESRGSRQLQSRLSILASDARHLASRPARIAPREAAPMT